MRRWRRCDGQAANEYVALLAIVAVLLISAVGLTSGGVGGQLLAGLQRGLCAVTGTACPRPPPLRADLPACPLERRVQRERLSETVGVVKLGTNGTLSAVRHSDGRVTVTLSDGSVLGAEVGLGARLAFGARGTGADARAGAEAIWGSGRAWHFPDAASAAAFVDRYGAKATIGGKLVDQVRSRCSIVCDVIGWRPHARLPPPDETHAEGGAAARLTAALGLGERSSGGLEASGLLGRRETRAGETTWYFKLTAAAAAMLRIPHGELAGVGEGSGVVSYRIDRAGRPLQLGVTFAGEGAGRGALELARGRGAARGAGGGRAHEGVVVELDATLDLTDPDNLAPAAALVDALRSADPSAVGVRLAALGERIADHGRLDLRAYELDRTARGVGASIALGVKLGGAFERDTRRLRLIDALTRLPGLPFLARQDCLSA